MNIVNDDLNSKVVQSKVMVYRQYTCANIIKELTWRNRDNGQTIYIYIYINININIYIYIYDVYIYDIYICVIYMYIYDIYIYIYICM